MIDVSCRWMTPSGGPVAADLILSLTVHRAIREVTDDRAASWGKREPVAESGRSSPWRVVGPAFRVIRTGRENK